MSDSTPEGADLLSSPVRRTIVDYIAHHDSHPCNDAPEGLTAAQVSEVLNVHVTTARFHLDQLVSGGVLEASFVKQGVGRPRKVYRLVAGSPCDHADSHAIGILADLLTGSESARPAGERLTPFEAGRRWAEEHVPADRGEAAATPGQWLARIGLLIDVLREWGYTTNLSGFDSSRTVELELVQCPFLDLAQSNPDIVCGVHRGLITGTLQQLGEDDVDVSVEPFSRANRCLVHITTHHPFSRRRGPTSHPDSGDGTTTQPRHDPPSKETA